MNRLSVIYSPTVPLCVISGYVSRCKPAPMDIHTVEFLSLVEPTIERVQPEITNRRLHVLSKSLFWDNNQLLSPISVM